MKKLSIFILSMVCALTPASAQTFTQHLQQHAAGSSLGTVKVTQDKEIDVLVNNNQQQPQKPAEKKQIQAQKPAEKKQEQAQKPVEKKKVQPEEQEDIYDDSDVTPAVPDMSKKILKNAIKIDGYRVQIYSGGNSRNDKARATQIGHQIKYAFPDQPVYVHFKSPHWICRMGNYRTQYEAQAFLDQVKALGYKQAILVKGKITVSR